VLELPILAIPRAAGDAALLSHALTADERRLFLKMDSACVQLPEDTELEGFHERVVGIGAEAGLSRVQSIALWTRVTFSLFEPEEFQSAALDPNQLDPNQLEPNALEGLKPPPLEDRVFKTEEH
jgi:hypothetical protein